MNSFVFYKSFADAIADLPAEQYKAIMIALTTYALEDEEPKLDDPFVKALFTLMKPQIDANQRRREAGRKGGEQASVKQIEANAEQDEANLKQDEANLKQNEANAKQSEASFKQNEASAKQSEANVKQSEANVNVNANVNANANVSKSSDLDGAQAHEPSVGRRVRNKLIDYFVYLEALDQKPLSAFARKVITQKLVSITDVESKQLQLIDEAMKNGWRNVYERGDPSAGKAKNGIQGEATDLDAWLIKQTQAAI